MDLNNVMLLYVTKTYAMANHMDAIVGLDIRKLLTYWELYLIYIITCILKFLRKQFWLTYEGVFVRCIALSCHIEKMH